MKFPQFFKILQCNLFYPRDFFLIVPLLFLKQVGDDLNFEYFQEFLK